ncbi:MAG TPA: hypothetical protein VGK10_10160 [Prolixibacteraceae bacterium]|jgi:hypothetical protein
MGFGITGIGLSLIKLGKLNITNIYFRSIFIVYMFWQIYIIMRGIHDFNYNMFLNILFAPYFFLHYLVPLIILIPANIFFVKRMFNFFVFLSIFLFIDFVFFENDLLFTNPNFSEQTVWTLGTGAGFLLLTWFYHNQKIRFLALLAVMLCLFIATITARRNIMITFADFIIFSVIIVLLSSRQSIKSKIYILTMFLGIIIAAYFIFLSYQEKLFGKISEHIDKNTRELVFNAFYQDMTSKDLIIGKGFLGEYYCPGAEKGVDNRFLIESGYLQTILKGGVISLALFLLIALPAAYLGIIKSKNILSKASGTIIILWLIDMVPWGMPAINIRYILVWTCIGICYSKVIRNLSEAELKYSLLLFSK